MKMKAGTIALIGNRIMSPFISMRLIYESSAWNNVYTPHRLCFGKERVIEFSGTGLFTDKNRIKISFYRVKQPVL